jgi:iron-sulfur cluster repair protein YtfE (RIC family)
MPLTAPLQAHHHRCDALFAAAERAAEQGDWGTCARDFAAFSAELKQHFRTEEEILFPAFEAATGMPEGPTRVMRMEHNQMRGLLAQMDVTLSVRDAEGFGGSAETLLILMQQHNMKEENILYPLCDRTLGEAGTAALAAALEGATRDQAEHA